MNPVNEVANICPVCHQNVPAEYYFCPNCGHNLKEKPMPVPIIVQIGLYALAVFLPPLGLWPGAKYLMKKGPQAKWVGGITVALTVISSALAFGRFFPFLPIISIN